MKKTLTVKFQKQCIGCELCVFEAQRQLKKIALEGSLIRIVRNKTETTKKLEFHVDLDPRINKLDIEKICNICPTNVFEIIEMEDDATELSF